MDRERLLEILEAVRGGKTTPSEAASRLADLPFADLGFARVDTHRALRCGFPEVIFGQGKQPEQAARIAERILADGTRLLATRVSPEVAAALLAVAPDGVHHEQARAVTVVRDERPAKGLVAILCAGTADVPVAEEARVTAEVMGARTTRVYDCGVAGIHRLLAAREQIEGARALVVVAGMEGALASVVGGIVDKLVVAVPTSVGYGASFGGVAPLLTMLNSCASGVTVVNIDNGFGGGYAAALVNRLATDDGGGA